MDLMGFFQKVDSLEKQKEAETSLNLAGDAARKCLSHDDFKRYKAAYEKAEEEMIDLMISYTKNFVESDKGDTGKYAMTMMRLVTKLQDFRALLWDIERDSKRGLNNG